MSLEMDALVTRPLNVILQEKTNTEARFYDARCIQIMLGELNILEFSFDEDTKNTIIQKGKDAVIHYWNQQIKPKRRNSFS